MFIANLFNIIYSLLHIDIGDSPDEVAALYGLIYILFLFLPLIAIHMVGMIGTIIMLLLRFKYNIKNRICILNSAYFILFELFV